MQLVRILPTLALALLFVVSPAVDGAAQVKPKLSLTSAPRQGSTSTVFVFRGILSGVEDREDFYCLTAEWLWEEQADSSLNEAECPTFVVGETKVDRSFTEEQSFRRPGPHRIRLVLRKGEREIASASANVTVRPE